MAVEITVPRLGWSSEEGVFAGWLKQPGDRVVSGEPLFALESDKVTMEVESLDTGVLHVVSGGPENGAVVTVGQLLGYLLAPGDPVPGAAPQAEPRRPVSPRARARARSLGIDIASVVAAPGARRVVEADVLRAAESLAVSARVSEPAALRARKVTAARLEESFRAPHFYVHAEADATALAKLRDDLLPVVEERRQVRLTYNDLLVKAAGLALRSVPRINCYWRQGEVVALDTAHIGLAVQTADRLLVPVIRDADRLPLIDIAAARHQLVERSRRGELRPADLEGASLSISNLGPYGVDRFQAILNPPQSAIIAVGRIAKRPFVEGDSVVARLTVAVSISVDHRAVDGVAAAEFLQAFVRLIEAPVRLLV